MRNELNMQSKQLQSIWMAILFILLSLVIGLAAPILSPVIVVMLILGGRWTLRQPDRTATDVFIGRTAIVTAIVFGVGLFTLIAVNRAGYTVETVQVVDIIPPVQSDATPSL